MKTQHILLKIFLFIMLASLAACGGDSAIKPEKKQPEAAKEKKSIEPEKAATPEAETKTTKGGYYLDDGPGENPPSDIDSIPDATPKPEELSTRANRPYLALEQQYTPMTTYQPYQERGKASWYGKRYHGKRTSTGEVYDMYGMTAAHTILPIPSYAKVTNVANGRSVIVRINDRGPFKNNRLIDLSYAAAYKLRMTDQGSAMVEVEAIDSSFEALQKNASPTNPDTINQEFEPKKPMVVTNKTTSNSKPTKKLANAYFVQLGAFKSEENSAALIKKMESYQQAENVEVTKAYNNGLYRVKVGPYATRAEADVAANKIRKQFNINAVVSNTGVSN